ncbi:hypothetical protein [uncultured Tateyamaria sp.]|uniref:tetratricopeptide repeat protein n=1 Tax=uncultured Tateyamaria sp. TaxID=455651 RepID=UPI00261F64AE|nr:hypothetical protein [uncultured Tateyamaria sp.]
MIRAALAVAVALWATAAVPQTQDQPERASISLDQARVLARQALHAGDFELARQIAMGLVQADETDAYAYGILAAAHSRMNNPKLARAAVRLSYRHGDSPGAKFGAARTAASIAYQQERPTLSQAWLRIAAAHADTDKQKNLLASDYRNVRAANPLSFNLTVSVAPSDNVNNGTDNVLEVINGTYTQGLFGGATRALSGVVGVVDARLRYRLARDKTSQTNATARIYTRQIDLSASAKAAAPFVSNSDFASTFAEAGLEHQFAAGKEGNSVTLSGAVGASWSGGSRSYDFGKLSVRRGIRLSPADRLSFSGTAEKRFSTRSSLRDVDVFTLGTHYSHRRDNGDRVNLGLTVQDVSGAFTNADYRTASVRASYAFGKQVGPVKITTGVTFGYTDYDTYVLVSPVAGGREDQSLYGDVSFFFADYDFAGFAPTVQVRTGRRSSNVNRFEIGETTISLGIQSKF